jgi:spore maturation protein CgeB
MRITCFTQSLVSCWNHGNAHFLRGVMSELLARGHEVRSYEPANGWSRSNLVADHGIGAIGVFGRDYPELAPHAHCIGPDVDAMLDGADIVLVHEWTDPALVAAIGRRRQHGRFLLLFHDTHHRAVSDPQSINGLDLSCFDGVLAFGEALARVYRQQGWGSRAFVWHEAADTRRFHPPKVEQARSGIVWIGNGGDEERSRELHEYLLHPVASLKLPLDVYGVRYPNSAIAALEGAGARYRGWLPNSEVPAVFARRSLTVHIPRRYYTTHLPGIPTIRVFEALACGIPLLSAPWRDSERLFQPGTDFLMARSPEEMRDYMRALAADDGLRAELSLAGVVAIAARHTCAHRVDELLGIAAWLGMAPQREAA